MILKKSHALLTVLAIAASPALAQEAETPAPEPATEAPAETPAESPVETAPEAAPEAATEAPATDASDAEDGETAQAEGEAEPRIGSYYLRSTHADWTVRCIRTEEGRPDPCELYQLMTDEDDNAVAEVTMIPLQNGEVAAGATLIAPLETDLMHGLGLGVDNAEARGYPFSFCAPVGCISRMGFTPDELAAMKRGNKAVVTLLPFGADPEQPVRLDMSLSGFTAAFAEVEELAEAAGDAAPTVIDQGVAPAE